MQSWGSRKGKQAFQKGSTIAGQGEMGWEDSGSGGLYFPLFVKDGTEKGSREKNMQFKGESQEPKIWWGGGNAFWE